MQILNYLCNIYQTTEVVDKNPAVSTYHLQLFMYLVIQVYIYQPMFKSRTERRKNIYKYLKEKM